MRLLLFAFLLCGNVHLYAQKKVFIGENKTYIDSVLYQKKCARTIVNCLKNTYNKDTTAYLIQKKYTFDKFSNKKMKRITQLFNKGKKLEKTLLVKSHDSIALIANILYRADYKVVPKIENEKNNFFLEIKKERYKKPHFTITKKFLENYQLFLNKKNKCLKKLYKKNIDVIYKTANGFIKLYPEIKIYNYKHDSLPVFNFINLKSNIVVKPNGQYFKFIKGIPKNKLNKILKAKKWNKYKESLNKSLNDSKDGFFDNMDYRYSNYTCF